MILSVIMLPELNKHVDQQIMMIDIESPIRLREFFTSPYSGWLKLAYRHGIGLAVLCYVIQDVVIYGAALLALEYFYGIGIRLTVYPMTIIPITTYRLYRQIEKRLSVQEVNTAEQVAV